MLTVAAVAAASSSPMGPFSLSLMYNLIKYTKTVQVTPTTAAIMMRAPWSRGVTTVESLDNTAGEVMTIATQLWGKRAETRGMFLELEDLVG